MGALSRAVFYSYHQQDSLQKSGNQVIMESLKRNKRIGQVFLLALAVLVGSLGWMTYRQIRQDRLNRPLIAAIRANDTAAVQHLLAQGADANACADEERQVSSMQRLEIALFRLLHGDSPGQSCRKTTLMLVVRADDPDPSARGDNPDITRALLDQGADTYSINHALPAAVARKFTQTTALLLERGADVNTHQPYEISPLMYACDNRDDDTVRLLLRHGADVNAHGYEGRFTPLIMTTEFGVATTMQILLEHGADVDAQDRYGHTALMLVPGEDLRKVKLLLTYKANVNLHDKQGNTALSLATAERDFRKAQLLRQAGAKE